MRNINGFLVVIKDSLCIAFHVYCSVEKIYGQKKGFIDLNHLAYKAKRHENSQVHMQNAVSLSLLGIVNIENKLESQYRNKIKKHNENVKDNRYILNIIINC